MSLHHVGRFCGPGLEVTNHFSSHSISSVLKREQSKIRLATQNPNTSPLFSFIHTTFSPFVFFSFFNCQNSEAGTINLLLVFLLILKSLFSTSSLSWKRSVIYYCESPVTSPLFWFSFSASFPFFLSLHLLLNLELDCFSSLLVSLVLLSVSVLWSSPCIFFQNNHFTA